MNKPSNTTNDVINVYFRTTVVSAFFMRPSSGPSLQKEDCLKLVNCNLLVVRDPVTKVVFSIHRCIV
jgi:hypothetical protein